MIELSFTHNGLPIWVRLHLFLNRDSGSCFDIETFSIICIPITKIRWSWGCIFYIMMIHLLVRQQLYTAMTPRQLQTVKPSAGTALTKKSYIHSFGHDFGHQLTHYNHLFQFECQGLKPLDTSTTNERFQLYKTPLFHGYLYCIWF